MAKIFINYRSADTAHMAVHLYEKLAERFGPDLVFRDDRSLEPGRDFRSPLWSHLQLSEVMLVLIGRHWLEKDETGQVKLFDKDDFVRREIEEALRMNIRVIPVLTGGGQRLSEKDLPKSISELAYRQYLHVRDRDAVRDMDALIDRVAEIIPSKAKPPVLRPAQPGGISIGGNVQGPVVNGHIDNSGVMTFGDHSPGQLFKQSDADGQ